MLYPLKFQPVFVERVWGGRELARFGKTLPAGKLIGESWEICDRPDVQTTVANGPLRGQTLRELIRSRGYSAIVGLVPPAAASDGVPDRFPLLLKLLDARQRLSLQVHPPAHVAAQLGGEPKTEMWYILDAAPGAHLIAGFRRGVTRAAFEAALASQNLEPLVHRFPVRTGDAIFIPSGRIHAIDAGLVIIEIQQNSDTTYRVYDWGRPRELHIAQSLASINFDDFEPAVQPLPIACEYFRVELLRLESPHTGACTGESFHILIPVDGTLRVETPGNPIESAGVAEFVLLPAALGSYRLLPGCTLLKVTAPPSRLPT